MAITLTAPSVASPSASKSTVFFQRILHEPAYQAFWLLRVAFVAAPVAFGIDKFFNGMTFWPKYLWVGLPHALGVSPQHFMYGVGVVEIAAGVMVLLLPRFAPYVVGAWLAGIITNLVIISAAPGHTVVYWDIALRDFGLLLAAVALGRLASAFHAASVRSDDKGR